MTQNAALGALSGWTVIVTGGTSGVGRATCLALGARGADVVVVGRDRERLRAVEASLVELGTHPLALVLDVREASEMEEMARRVLDHSGRIDALIACAAIARRPDGPLIPYAVAQMPVAEWTDVMATNLRGVFLANRAVLPSMMSARTGVIANVVSSPGGIHGQPFAAVYCASKFAVAGLTESLAAEVSRFGIRVFGVFPDLVNTPMVEKTTLAARLGPGLAPERVASFVSDLLVMPHDAHVPSIRQLGYPVLKRVPHPERVASEGRR